ncbi:MAG: glycosyltransferase family 9 protein [Phycisphaerales bacterium]|nr:glycosyltransferase family 9 protein [Phycisphaerales bacterium]
MLPRRNVLIFHGGALGDFVLTWPLAVALGRLYPQSRIFYVTASQKGKLAEQALGVESVDVESGWHGLYSDEMILSPAELKLLASAHTIALFTPRQADPVVGRLLQLNPETKVLSLHPPMGEKLNGPAAGFILDQLASDVVLHTAMRQILKSIADRGLAARHQPESICLHPGSGGVDKCWPLDRFIELARHLQSERLPLCWVIGEVERERLSTKEMQRLEQVGSIIEPATLTDLLRHILSARLWVGNDSGPTHLAGIMAVPTIALFGPTDPNIWKPLGPKVHALRQEPIERLPVDEVWSCCRALL